MWTAITALALAMLSDEEHGWMPATGNSNGVGAWLLITNSDEPPVLLSTIHGVLEYEKMVNDNFEDQEPQEERTRSLKTWLERSRPGWVDDGYWDIIWIFAIGRNAIGTRGVAPLQPLDVPLPVAKFPFTATQYATRVALGDRPQGNAHDVSMWFVISPPVDPATQWSWGGACTVGGVLAKVRWYKQDLGYQMPARPWYKQYPGHRPPTSRIPRSTSFVHPGRAKELKYWLQACRPGDTIVDDFGLDWVIAIAEDSVNTAGARPYIDCLDVP